MCDEVEELVKAEVADTKDFISELPNVLLTRVLSYLPTKEVIRTSVLSKRWNQLWPTVPTLELRVSDFLPRGTDLYDQRRTNFLAFVEKFLSQNHPCKINVLELTSFSSMPMEILSIELFWSPVGHRDYENYPLYPGEILPHSHSNLESWLLLARRFKVHCLHMFCNDDKLQYPQLRPNFYMFEKLEYLGIQGCMVLNFPVGSIFPNLKVLKLDITFRDENSISNLINFSCPVLEDLTVYSRGDENDLNGLVINVKTLTRLTLGYWEFGAIKIPKGRINVPSLKYLSMDDVLITFTDNDLVGVWGPLNEAELYVSTEDVNSLFWLLLRIRDVKKLTLSEYALKSLKLCTLPKFHNLTCLVIQVLEDATGWETLVKVLKMSPILDYLLLEGIDFNFEGVFDWNAEHNIPRCLTTSLKTIEIGAINGYENELEIMGYFLKQSKVLEKIKVHIERTDDQLEIDIEEYMLASPKGSPECNIVFIFYDSAALTH